MACPRVASTIGVLLAALALASPASAAGGRITFSGQILEPTCLAFAPHLAELARRADTGVTAREAGRCDHGPARPAGAGYRLAVTTLADGSQADRLLAYFTGYLAPGREQAHLVTQTFE